MKRKIFTFSLMAMLVPGIITFSQESGNESPVSFVLNVSPVSYLICPDISDFYVSKYGGYLYYSSFTEDRIQGFGILTPSMKVGVGFNTEIVLIDLLAGGGYAISGAIHGSFFTGDIYCKFRASRIFTIGIHTGVMNWSPLWDFADIAFSDEGDVKFSTVTGLMIGPVLTVGKRANFTFSIDYMSGNSNIKTYNDYYANHSSLDFSGVMLNLGFLLRVP